MSAAHEPGPPCPVSDFRAELEAELWRCPAVEDTTGAPCFKTIGHVLTGTMKSQLWHTGVTDNGPIRWFDDGRLVLGDREP